VTPGRPRVVISIFDHSAYRGGGQVVAGQIIDRLRRDYEVVLVTTRSPVDWAGMRSGVTVIDLPVGWAGPRLAQLLYHPLLMLAALRTRHDVWIESFTPPVSSSLLPLLTRRPVIGLAQTLSAREMVRRYRLPLLLRIERFALRRYGHLVVLNPFDRQQVQACNPRADVRLIPNGIAMPDYHPAEPGTDPFCLFLGRIDVRLKGLDLLAAAYRRVSGALPLVIAGSGMRGDADRLAELVRPLAGRVRLAGYVHGVRKTELLDGAAFLVMPSRAETFGLVALEAMAHGKPVVHFDLPQLSWIPADCGVKVPAFDVAAFGSAIEELSRDTTRRAALGRNARAFAERHNAAATGDAYAHLVKEILGR
jgi:glycosyltransferase involved in cell wall biosynthesis